MTQSSSENVHILYENTNCVGIFCKHLVSGLIFLSICCVGLLIYLGVYVAFNTIQVISRRVVGRAEEASTYSLPGFCTVNYRPMARNHQLSHLRPCRELNPGLRGGRQECYHSAPVAPICCVEHNGYMVLVSEKDLK